MRTGVAILRWILWIEGAAFLVAAATIVSDPDFIDSFRWIVLAEGTYGILVLVAALALQLRLRWASAAGLTISALNVLLIVMSPIGVFGLILLCQKRGRNQLGPKPPPLPGAVPPQRARASDIALVVITLAACQPMFRYLNVTQVPTTPIPLLILGLCVEVWVVVLVHELGHLAAGWVCGFRLVQLAVGRTVLVRQDERWRLTRVKKPMAGGWAGIQPKTTELLREKYVLFAAGGPLASLLFAVLLFGLFLASPGRPWALLSPVIGITALVSFQTFVGNSLPLPSKRGLRDGRLMLELCRRSRDGERLMARLQTLLIFTTPLRPRDLPADWIQTVVSISDDSNEHKGGCIRTYEYLLDAGHVEAAGKWLDEWLRIDRASPSGIGRDYGLTEVAFFEARYRGNAAAARALLQEAHGQFMVERYTNCRVWAAVMLAEGKDGAARELAAQARADLERRTVTGHRLFERDLLDDLEKSATPSMLELPCATVPL